MYFCHAETVEVGMSHLWFLLSILLLTDLIVIGGTVYHDQGNLNCSFFTSRARYNRKYNLETICGSIRSRWNLDLTISPREDILLNSYKVSGTASKLGHRNAYHHWSAMFFLNRIIVSLVSKNIITSFSTVLSLLMLTHHYSIKCWMYMRYEIRSIPVYTPKNSFCFVNILAWDSE